VRKNNGDRKKDLVRVKAYCTYQIDGLNLDNLINHLARQNFTLLNVKKLTNKRLIVSVNYLDSKKLFAIAKDLCYNIKKVKNTGRDLPFIRLYKHVGLLLGAVVFLFSVLTFNDLVLSIDYVGSGSVYKREVEDLLLEQGIGQFSKFSSLDLRKLEDKILAKSQSFSFVSCQKKGSRLIVELIISDKSGNSLTGNVEKMVAQTSGVIENLKVYRGKAMVKTGDLVNVGDLLVSGYATVKEQEVWVGVIAYVSILSEYAYEYVSDQDNLEDAVLELVKNERVEENVVDERINKEKSNDKFVYKCVLTVRREYTVG